MPFVMRRRSLLDYMFLYCDRKLVELEVQSNDRVRVNDYLELLDEIIPDNTNMKTDSTRRDVGDLVKAVGTR